MQTVTNWPVPPSLEGVKSRKRAVFEADRVEITAEQCTLHAQRLSISLSSRVLALDIAGDVAEQLLTGETATSCGQLSRHAALNVLSLGPSQLLSNVRDGVSYREAVAAAIQDSSPHVLILQEAKEKNDSVWEDTFNELIDSCELRNFRGAVLVVASQETEAFKRLCSERWVVDGCRVQQQPCLQVIDNLLDDDARAGHLIQQALSLDYCNLTYWFDRARESGWSVTAFASCGCEEGSSQLLGLIFHHMIARSAEFHTRFIFVPKSYRNRGLGGRLVRWIIDKAAQMSQSECRWISLSAADDSLVEWYEKFGFTDMTCGHTDGDDDMTWMEMPNVSLVPDEA